MIENLLPDIKTLLSGGDEESAWLDFARRYLAVQNASF